MALAEAVLVNAEDYRALPEAGPRYQLIEGRLYMAPAPNRYHQDISQNLEFIFRRFLAKHPIGKMYHAPFDVYLDEHNVFQPDIIFVADNRLSILTDEGAAGAPTLVIEVLSERTARLDKQSKRKVYAGKGVEELWLVSPLTQSIEVYALREDSSHPVSAHQANDTFSSACLPGLVISAAEIFAQ